MFVGVIETKDILLHPREIIRMRGLRGYLKLVWRALRRKPYSFIGMTQQSDWIFDKQVQKEITDSGIKTPHAAHTAGAHPHKNHESKSHAKPSGARTR